MESLTENKENLAKRDTSLIGNSFVENLMKLYRCSYSDMMFIMLIMWGFMCRNSNGIMITEYNPNYEFMLHCSSCGDACAGTATGS